MPIIIAFCLSLALLVSDLTPVWADAPPATPFIRINTRLHSAKIMDMAASRDGKVLATVSFDKTVKLWDAESGKLINTIRPPIGAGIEGVLHAVALSPDGRTVAAGGWTGSSWDGRFSVYLFDVATGEIKQRLPGFPKPVSKLAFSPGGDQLAVGLHSSGGLYLISISERRRVVADSLPGVCTSLEYDRAGNLFVVSDGGVMRRYRPDGTLQYSLQTGERSRIMDAALSPDGKQLALVYQDSFQVELRSATDGHFLKLLQRPGGKFMSVAWSVDGSQILAAGHNKAEDDRKILMIWNADSGYLDELVATPANTVVSTLLVLPDGSVAFVSRLSGFGLLRFDEPAVVSHRSFYGRGLKKQFTLVERKQAYYHALAVADFFKNHDTFRISRDASSVLFSYERYGKALARFDLKTRRLTVPHPTQDDLLPRRVTADGIDLQNWYGASEPRLNRVPLGGFESQELNWSLAVRNDEQGFVLGTNLYLRSYNRKGQLLVKKRIPYTAKNIALSADDRMLVAALDDGSIRWYRMPDGEEKYALFPHPDRKRWILWTPDGFFDHGSGSENLIGFQVNRGAEQSSLMVGADRMFDLLYRPDLLDRAIAGENLAPYLLRLQKRSSGPLQVDPDGVRAKPEKYRLEQQLQQHAEMQRLDQENKAEELARLQREQEQAERAKKAAGKAVAEPAEQAQQLKMPLQDEDPEPPLDAIALTALVEPKTALSGLVTTATLPPKVRFLTGTGTSQSRDMLVKAELCDTGGGIGNITLFLNNMPIVFEQSGRGLVSRSKAGTGCTPFERIITLASGENVISLTAFNALNSIESEQDQITIRYTSPEPAKPRLHLLTVAVNNYREKELRLKYSVNDAAALTRIVTKKGKQLFTGIQSYQLYDEQVTRSGLEAIFASVSKNVQRGDVFVLFVAGHGLTDELDGMYYFLPADFRFDGIQSLAQSGISMNDFKRLASSIPAMRSLFLIDTCNSGAFSEGMAQSGIAENTALGKLARSVGRATIAASSRNQVALEGYQGHGVFSYTVLEAMKGEAANRKGQITINALATFIEETLPGLTFKKWGYEQIPQKTLIGSDFSIGIK